ncbi:hypothetical protein CSUB_C1108 [Candidatus Caldarchaeum subterraneum]|uniref:Glycosyl transferase family protein n=1 Tax=Caldiarchaeum subterraneum TaxID=311458 RepID=E6N416_CALS0|nr:glycosyl transferase family protein [Candidatus Caldarchaeum subterraneum]BAJ48179.1 hypothetical protein HGMM_F33A05C18 [Candidatus Caldarchaeum subterraneum]BAJ50960.1 hypothetical protein CSUB_C1108 [Candidatus Caldarchaeum subterraneum]
MKSYIVVLSWIALGLALFTTLYIQNVYPLDIAVGYISRAQSAGYAEDMVSYVKQALQYMPQEGNPVWIFPTTRTDFNLINKDLNTIVGRLSTVATLPRESSAYSQALNDIRERLSVIVENVGEAMPYIMFSPTNLTIILLWLFSLLAVIRLSRKFRTEKQTALR